MTAIDLNLPLDQRVLDSTTGALELFGIYLVIASACTTCCITTAPAPPPSWPPVDACL